MLNSPCLCPLKFCLFFFFSGVFEKKRVFSSLWPLHSNRPERADTGSCAIPPARGGIPGNSAGAWLTDCHKIQLWRRRSAWLTLPWPESNVTSEEMDLKVIINGRVQNQKSCRWCRLLWTFFQIVLFPACCLADNQVLGSSLGLNVS